MQAAREIMRAFGKLEHAPTVVGTDNSANLQIAARHASAVRARHALRRWTVFTQRMRDGECLLAKCPGAQMPADFLTKWLDKKKAKLSLAYATNVRNAVPW